VGPHTCKRYAITGEPVVTLTSAGIRKEGEVLAYSKSMGRALKSWKLAFSKYCISVKNASTIYWREDPTVRYNATNRGFLIYARLLVSSALELSKEEFEKL
jgi:hypothetical protein